MRRCAMSVIKLVCELLFGICLCWGIVCVVKSAIGAYEHLLCVCVN